MKPLADEGADFFMTNTSGHFSLKICKLANLLVNCLLKANTLFTIFIFISLMNSNKLQNSFVYILFEVYMKNVLVLKSSILAEHSQSNLLSDYLVSKLSANVTTRDLVAQPLPYFTGEAAAATRGEPQSDAQKSLLALSDSLVAELKGTDVVVINAPMYNFSVPAQLKSYFDFVARAGVTFQYTAEGPEGLVKGKKAVVILTTGGIHKDAPTDLVKNYVQTFLGFIGITDVQFVYAEALGYGPEAVEKAQQAAKAELDKVAESL